MRKRKINQLPFDVSPNVIVEQARTLVLSGEWMRGYELLTNSFIGMDYEYAEALMSGNGEMVVELSRPVYVSTSDDEYERVQRQQYEVFSKFHIEDGICHKPICHIIGLSSQDAHYAHETYGNELTERGLEDKHSTLINRMEFYVDKNFHDVAKKVYGKHDNQFIGVWVIKTDSQLPPWLDKKELSNEFLLHIGAGKTASRRIHLNDMKVLRSHWFNSTQPNQPTEELPAKNQRAAEAPNVASLSKQIWDINGSDHIMIEGRKVALKPFLCWASRFAEKRLIDEVWSPVSPQHWKTMNDSTTHSDWVVSAGINPEKFYEEHSSMNNSAYKAALEYVRKERTASRSGIKLTPLVVYRESNLQGVIQYMVDPSERVLGDIVVTPDCSIKWRSVALEVGKRGGIIIAYAGGELSHLVMASDQIGATIYLSPEVEGEFQNFSEVTVCYDTQTVSQK